MKRHIWLDKWTEKYIEGLPVGNGRLAAMMLGRPEKLRIALNHEWMWRGENRFRECEETAEHLPEVREALLRGDFLEGTSLANKYFGGSGGVRTETYRKGCGAGEDSFVKKYFGDTENTEDAEGRVDPYQPVGDVWIGLNAKVTGAYKRSLDLDTGLAKTEYESDHGPVTERLFVSCTDDCLVADVSVEKACDMTVMLSRIEDPRCTIIYENETDGLRMKGAFLDGISFEACVRIITDGVWECEENCLNIKDAAKLLLFVQIGTDAKGVSPELEMIFPKEDCFDSLFARHEEMFRTLKGDAAVEVDVEDCDLPTDQRIRLFQEGGDPALPLLFFEYGRYLMVSGSSGELPLNLQGKWNEDLQPPWECDYHLDINLQMAYWFVETLGMKDAANTLFNLIERYVPYGRVVAEKLYGCKGMTMCIQTDVWGRVTPESCGWSVWIGAAPWLGQHMFMHWRYTKDMQFLKERCYPYLKEAAAFYEDYLLEKDDELWILPSYSPENRFEGTGEWPVSIGINGAMDIQLVTELLSNAAECADILGVDADKAAQWRNMVSRLPKLSVDSRGRLNEWDKERVEPEPGHRHFSHLYGLYPGQLFEPDSIEWKAAERSLEERLRNDAGQGGWTLSWAACMMARLGRREDAWENFIGLIKKYTTVSLLDTHEFPPEIPAVFQIDGNMGGTAIVCEMLMQSRRGRLMLLPALPVSWEKGCVRNFRAQDGLNVSFSWEKGRLTSFELISQEDQELEVICDGREWKLKLEAGKRQRLN